MKTLFVLIDQDFKMDCFLQQKRVNQTWNLVTEPSKGKCGVGERSGCRHFLPFLSPLRSPPLTVPLLLLLLFPKIV